MKCLSFPFRGTCCGFYCHGDVGAFRQLYKCQALYVKLEHRRHARSASKTTHGSVSPTRNTNAYICFLRCSPENFTASESHLRFSRIPRNSSGKAKLYQHGYSLSFSMRRGDGEYPCSALDSVSSNEVPNITFHWIFPSGHLHAKSVNRFEERPEFSQLEENCAAFQSEPDQIFRKPKTKHNRSGESELAKIGILSQTR